MQMQMAIKREGVQCELYMQRCGPNASSERGVCQWSESVSVQCAVCSVGVTGPAQAEAQAKAHRLPIGYCL